MHFIISQLLRVDYNIEFHHTYKLQQHTTTRQWTRSINLVISFYCCKFYFQTTLPHTIGLIQIEYCNTIRIQNRFQYVHPGTTTNLQPVDKTI
jgi:hypothetical protein